MSKLLGKREVRFAFRLLPPPSVSGSSGAARQLNKLPPVESRMGPLLRISTNGFAGWWPQPEFRYNVVAQLVRGVDTLCITI